MLRFLAILAGALFFSGGALILLTAEQPSLSLRGINSSTEVEGWSGDIRLTDGAVPSHLSDARADWKGDIHIVWVEGGMVTGVVKHTLVSPTGARLQPDATLTTRSAGMEPRIAVDGEGGAHIIWSSMERGMLVLYYTKFVGGTPAFPPVQLAEESLHSLLPEADLRVRDIPWERNAVPGVTGSIAIKAALDATGRTLHIAWVERSSEGGWDIMHQDFDLRGNAVSGAVKAAGERGEVAGLAMTAAGESTLIFWVEKRQGGGEGLYTAVLDGTVNGTVMNIDEGKSVGVVSAVPLRGGGAALAWRIETGDAVELAFGSVSSSGGLQRMGEVQGARPAGAPAISGGDGSLYVAWSQDVFTTSGLTATRASTEVFAAPVDPLSGTVGNPRRLTVAAGDSMMPLLTFDSAGRLRLLWCDSRDGPSQLYLKYQTRSLLVSEGWEVQKGVERAGGEWAVMGLVSIIAGAAVTLKAAVGGSKGGGLFFLAPLYSRIERAALLDHSIRASIYTFIVSHPGVHFTALMTDLDLKNGVLSYHLSMLERREFIRSVRDGAFRRYYPAGMRLPPDFETVLMDQISTRPGSTPSELGRDIGGSRQTVNYHVNHLARRGAIRLVKEGKTLRCYPSNGIAAAT